MEVANQKHLETHTAPGVVRDLSIGIVFQFAIGGTFLPLVVLYLRDRGLEYSQVGQVYVGVSIVTALFPLLWGAVADRWIPVNRLIVGLHVCGALSLLYLSRQTTFGGLALGTALWYAFSMPTSALYHALSYHNLTRPRVEFGFIRMFGSIGWMLPAFVVWAWMVGSESFEITSVLVIAACIEVAFLLVGFLLPHTPPARPRGRIESHGAGFLAGCHRLLVTPGFALLMLVAFFMFWSFTVTFYYAPAQLDRVGVSREWILPIQCLAPVAEVPLFFLLKRVLAGIGTFRCLTLGCLAMVLRHGVCYLELPAFWLGLSYVLMGVAVVFYLTPISLAVDRLAPVEVRATAQTLLLIAGPGLGSLVGSLVSGHLAGSQDGDLRLVFGVGALVTVLGLLVLGLTALFTDRVKLDAA